MRLGIIAVALLVMTFIVFKTFDLSRELSKLQVEQAKLEIEKLKFELSIYREQEAANESAE